MEAKTTVEAHGRDLEEILRDAATQLASYYGDHPWLVVAVNAEPAARAAGRPIPELWRAEVHAETVASEDESRG